jgi:ABC-type multidrug transport system fused ATPase/permease subunit
MKGIGMAKGPVNAAVSMHKEMLKGVLNAKMKFHDETPTGVLSNRFLRDVETIDLLLPNTVNMLYECLARGLIMACIIGYATPIALIVLVPLIYYYIIQAKKFNIASRNIKRLDHVNHSPILNQILETIKGLTILRTHDKTDQYESEFISRVEKEIHTGYTHHCVGTWLHFRT